MRCGIEMSLRGLSAPLECCFHFELVNQLRDGASSIDGKKKKGVITHLVSRFNRRVRSSGVDPWMFIFVLVVNFSFACCSFLGGFWQFHPLSSVAAGK